MSLASRRMMLKGGTSQNVNETILTSNYEPNGEKFVFVNEWDVNGDTLYMEWVARKERKENIISIAAIDEPNKSYVISLWNPAGIRMLHYYDNVNVIYNNQEGDSMLVFSHASDYDKRLFFMLNYGINKLLINSNGLYINGVLRRYDTGGIFVDLAKNPYIVVGSMEGTSRSYDYYNKISVIHEKYTDEQMAKLTAV